MSQLITNVGKKCIKRNFAAAAIATSNTSNGWYPEFQPVHIESEYRSNLWVATLPFSTLELPTVTIKDRVVMIKAGKFENKEIKLPMDSIAETIMARFDKNKLIISVELEDRLNFGTPIPIHHL